ncbi:MAG: R3H domain-containing nucleic acid-binding protein [Coriobacteriales bacterium]|nr:R3H domain-containing nucleic acid-binding protein [Coriobacteriales bacterium]
MGDENVIVAENDEQTIGQPAVENEFAAIKAHLDEGLELTDDEVDAIADAAVGFLKGILACFGETKVSIDEYEGDDGELILDVTDGNLAVLIGRHGRTLDALQMIVSSLMSSTLHFHYPVVVDVEGYKNRRKEKLRNLALSAAARAKRQHSKVSLPPMNAYERRLVHLALVGDESVTTHSEGEEPSRHVVVTALRS